MSRNFELLAQVEQVLGAAPELPRTYDREQSRAASPTAADVDDIGRQEIARLVQHIFLSPNGSSPRNVVFCGVDDAGGSSHVCGRTARALAARTSHAVCIVDTQRHAHAEVNEKWSESFDNVRNASIRQQCQQLAENLWIAPASAFSAKNGATSIADLGTWLDVLRQEFDYVLVDAPPVAVHSEAVLLGQAADGVVLVLEANATRRIAAKKTKESLEGSNVRLLGTVLNNRTFPVPEKLYRRL